MTHAWVFWNKCGGGDLDKHENAEVHALVPKQAVDLHFQFCIAETQL